jgi:hypothetical protein
MSRMRIYEEEDDMSDSDYKEEDYDEEEDEDDTRAKHISAKRGTSQGKKDTSKMKGNMQDMIDLCEYREREIKKLKLEITKLKSQGRTTKQKLREDYQWDGDDAILADKVSDWVKTYLFPRYKFLKKGWMDYSEKDDSLSSFFKRKNTSSIPMSSDYSDLWDRVICPTIGNKYITIRCNLANDIRVTYKGKQRTIKSFVCS